MSGDPISQITRRSVLSGLFGLAGASAIADAPLQSLRPRPRPGEAALPRPDALVEGARLGGRVSFALADLASGEILETRAPLFAHSPASVAKAITAAYALDRLGPSHRFATRLVATGPVENGQIRGDLVLAGGGDPTLDSDGLAALVEALKAAGVVSLSGRFRIWQDALPALPWIDADQPDHVGYNPAIGGLNLNFNRVHFEWDRDGEDYEITTEARARRFSPSVDIAEIALAEEQARVFDYSHAGGVDRWSVARRALGAEGARWLPVRRPGDYAAEAFQVIARSYGLDLRRGSDMTVPPVGTDLARVEGEPLPDLMRGMLRYSTNLTAEVAGLTASRRAGAVPGTLAASAARMNGWSVSASGARRPALVDHSGLGYGSQISAIDMLRILTAPGQAETLRPILREFRVTGDDAGAGIACVAKTGTLNYVSALAGYLRAGRRDLGFVIFTSDAARRDAIPVAERERPPGARGWSRRSRALQRALLARWAGKLA